MRHMTRHMPLNMTTSTNHSDIDLLLLGLWAEVGRHRRLGESIVEFATLLQAQFGLQMLRIDEINADRSELETLAIWPKHHSADGSPVPVIGGIAAISALEVWAQRQLVASCAPGVEHSVPFTLIDGLETDAPLMAGALRTGDQLIGVVTLAGGPGTRFSAAAQNVLQQALAPLAAALQNDRRHREIQRLNASAEADRQTLLTRLGRTSLNEGVIGAELGLRRVMQRVDQVAPTDATVLILGETGAGKEVIARAIHERSARASGPFVRVNCGAVPPDLIDSELFGHEKGSFTGALATRRGWFERADGGTLFLDEIGELTPAVQIRLLRVLQDGIVQRVGSERDISVNVRVVAATHRDLPLMAQEGRFREDLWYRLAIFPVILPPLREHPEDIPLLAHHFVQRAANRLGVPVPPLRMRDIEHLQAYRWPGNVRELGAVLERAVILGQGVTLDLETALGGTPTRAQRSARSVAMSSDAGHNAEPASATGIQPLETVIAEHLKRALRATNGRVDGPHGAARLLGLNTSTLRAKLRKLGIRP